MKKFIMVLLLLVVANTEVVFAEVEITDTIFMEVSKICNDAQNANQKDQSAS